jgi:two-component system, NarL family, response regulator
VNGLNPLRVLIADDHPALRLGLASIVESMGGAALVGEAMDGEDAVVQFKALMPDVMTLDLRMPKLDGLLVLERIVAETPDARILVMTMYDHEEDIVRSVRAGARGHILKSAPRSEIVCALRKVGAGERYLPDYVAAKLATHLSSPALTAREHEVLELLRLGISNKEIGRQLGVTEGTVKAHVREVLAKLGAISRTEAVNLGIQRGLLK